MKILRLEWAIRGLAAKEQSYGEFHTEVKNT